MYPQVTISPTTDFNFLEKFEEYEKIERNKMRQTLAQSYLDTAHLGIHGLGGNVEKFSHFRSFLSLQSLHHSYLPPHLGQGLYHFHDFFLYESDVDLSCVIRD